MKQAVRAIVVRDDQLLVMHRNKFGRQYYTLVGGGLGPHETPERALMRELAEEAGITADNPRLVFIEEAGVPDGTQYFYACRYVSGEIQLHPDSLEAKINQLGQNLYTPMWLKLSDLPGVAFLSESLKRHLLDALEHGFPDTPRQIQAVHRSDQPGVADG
jgi:8-oxo-dGTP pyrophosphatase MutT (NUDIX family)